ncbi:MAG TPA: 3'-5' exonuclease [Chitinophagaceae bacterium]|nr:3'-5' exonuclease [Chitinophagaceae bacterium]
MNFNNILFLDIETASQYEGFQHLPPDWQELWEAKAQFLLRNKEGETAESIYEKAGIYAEFGRIICISCGCIQGYGEERKLLIKSFCAESEKKLLAEFAEMLDRWATDNQKFLCAHNGKEFDYPYICRRMIINGVSIPEVLQIAGRKPWDVRHLDTLELWKFGDYKSYTSLKLLAKVLGVPSPKDDIDGSQVNAVYWIEKDLDRIVHYCQKDVVTLAQVLLRFHCEPLIRSENVSIKYVQQNQL